MRVLKDWAQDERDAFERTFGGPEGNCSCHISPPCSCCTHPGNPRNQWEDPDAWDDLPEPEQDPAPEAWGSW